MWTSHSMRAITGVNQIPPNLVHKFNRPKMSRARVLCDTGCVRTPPPLSRHHPSEGFTLFTFERTSAENPSLSKQLVGSSFNGDKGVL